MLLAGVLLAVLSGLMNGLFTLPMRFLGRWGWENVWSVFIAGACLLLPVVVVAATAPASLHLLAQAPRGAVMTALATGLAWGFGAVMFGQSVSAIGIALANTLVLAISSALGSLLPLLLLSPGKLHERAGHLVLLGVAIELAGIALCGRAGLLRERAAAGDHARHGELVGHRRPLAAGLLLVVGAGLMSAVFNVGFALARPVAVFVESHGYSTFQANNLIWVLMLGAGAISNLGFCTVLFLRNRTAYKFVQPGSARLYLLGLLMAALWGGSIFVYGAATPRLGSLGVSIGWPLSLAVGLLVANLVGFALGEWRGVPRRAFGWMATGIFVLITAIVTLSRAG